MRKKESTLVQDTKMINAILEILKTEGFIVDFKKSDDSMIEVELAYLEDGRPVAQEFTRVSCPGQRMYVTRKEILPVMNGRGISIVSTSAGLMTGAMAKSKKLGGEYICNIW